MVPIDASTLFLLLSWMKTPRDFLHPPPASRAPLGDARSVYSFSVDGRCPCWGRWCWWRRWGWRKGLKRLLRVRGDADDEDGAGGGGGEGGGCGGGTGGGGGVRVEQQLSLMQPVVSPPPPPTCIRHLSGGEKGCNIIRRVVHEFSCLVPFCGFLSELGVIHEYLPLISRPVHLMSDTWLCLKWLK